MSSVQFLESVIELELFARETCLLSELDFLQSQHSIYTEHFDHEELHQLVTKEMGDSIGFIYLTNIHTIITSTVLFAQCISSISIIYY